MLVPEFVPAITASFFIPAVYTAITIAFIGLIGIAIEKRDIHILILTDIVGLAMLLMVASVGTDLAEILILPGLVVTLAEVLAISEILISREIRKIEAEKGHAIKTSLFPLPLTLDMEVMTTAPNFLALVMIAFGILLAGFTGGAVAGGGILLFALSRISRGLPIAVINGISGISGLAWCLWIMGFLLFFVVPEFWILSLFMAALGLVLKVASKIGLVGTLMREEYKRE